MVPKSPSERQTPRESANGSTVENRKLRGRSRDHIPAILFQLLFIPLLQKQPHSGRRQHHSKGCVNRKKFLEVGQNYLLLCRLQKWTFKRFSNIYTRNWQFIFHWQVLINVKRFLIPTLHARESIISATLQPQYKVPAFNRVKRSQTQKIKQFWLRNCCFLSKGVFYSEFETFCWLERSSLIYVI